MSETIVAREPDRRKVERELTLFRAWFSLLTFLLTAVAFIIGFPALEDAGEKIGLGTLAFGLPFAIDLGMVTLLLWSMWNRGALKSWWPPLIPAGLLLGLSSWLQYIHAVELVPEDATTLARWGLLILASALPLLLALSAGVFEAVTFAPLIDRAKRHSELMVEQQRADDELWRIEVEQRRASSQLDAQVKRSRIEIESRTQLQMIEAEAEAATRALRGPRSTVKPTKPSVTATPTVKQPLSKVEPKSEPPLREKSLEQSLSAASPLGQPREENTPKSIVGVSDEEAMIAAIQAVRAGTLSQRGASDHYKVSRAALRRRLDS